MSEWRVWYVIGSDATGSRAIVGSVSVPAEYDREGALLFVRSVWRGGPTGPFQPFAWTKEIEPDVKEEPARRVGVWSGKPEPTPQQGVLL